MNIYRVYVRGNLARDIKAENKRAAMRIAQDRYRHLPVVVEMDIVRTVKNWIGRA